MKPRPVILVLVALAVAAILAAFAVGLAWNNNHNHSHRGHIVAPFVPVRNYHPTAAERTCGKAIIEDWYPDGRVDHVYRLECYGAALGMLPTHPIDYSNVFEDITKAYQARRADLIR